MTDRVQLLRGPFTKSSRLIEVGASHSPTVPKSEGWNTVVVDHAPREELAAKYAGIGTGLARIEDVDVVWTEGELAAAFPSNWHGTFDGLIASHVLEHVPNLIGFLQSFDRLLKPTGIIALALPDKRLCFDFFRPLTSTGDLLEAHWQKRGRHTARTFYDWIANYVEHDGQPGWSRGISPDLKLRDSIQAAYEAFLRAAEASRAAYADAHAWVFTPGSFERLILELNELNLIPWWPTNFDRAPGVEFFVWLHRAKPVFTAETLQQKRMQLLQQTMLEMREAIDALQAGPGMVATLIPGASKLKFGPITSSQTRQMPTIAAIIPLYNGRNYIEGALRSVFAQTFPVSEIIVVNDGSEDDGPEIVTRLAQESPITLLHKPNGGQSSARNWGVAHSNSELIAFLDQDDLWYPSHLRELVKPFLREHNPELGWVYSDLDEIDETGHMVNWHFLRSLPVQHPKESIVQCLSTDIFTLPSASLVRRSAFDAVGGFDERLSGYEDDDLFLRLFRAGYKNVFIAQALSQWRIYPTSSSYTYRMGRSRIIFARKLLEDFPDDERRHRFYRRDLLAPRFFKAAMEEHAAAVKSGDHDLIGKARDEVRYIAGFVSPERRQIYYAQALAEFREALLGGVDWKVAKAWQRLNDVVDFLGDGQTSRLDKVLRLLRNPAIARRVFAARNLARPVMRYAFRWPS